MAATNHNLEELLAWYVEAGIDVALRDEPVNHFRLISAGEERQSALRPPAAEIATISAPAAIPKPAPTGDVIESAKAAAAGADSLIALKTVVETFEGCALKATARSTFFSDGNPQAKIMIIGEAPGRDEDEQGLPFVGRSGQLLNQMLKTIGLDRETVYITNVLPWRPPGNRTPTPAETAICRPFLNRHIELVEPDVLVLIGGSAAKTMLDTQKGIMSMRGRITRIHIAGQNIPTLPMLHPAYLLRQPGHKRLAWADLLKLQAHLAEIITSDD
jgi:DNA polymerase